MINVIKEGKRKVFRVECDRCGCLFEYDHRDVDYTVTYYYVICPCCGKRVVHKEKEKAK